MPESLKLFVLPPLLALVLVAGTLLAFTSYLSQRSHETTYVVRHTPRSDVLAERGAWCFARIPPPAPSR